MTATDTTSFADELRSVTAVDHQEAEGARFLGALAAGTLPRDGYVDLLAQYARLYDALEATGDRLAADPTVAPFLHEGLRRSAALRADLEDLAGPDWAERFPASAATTAYADRLSALASWPAGFVAHHYTRYLGDLSGGQFLGRAADRAYGLSPDHGGRFADFSTLGDPAAFKAAYRQALDAAPWDDEERARIVDEVHAAYVRNGQVLAALEHHAP